jgi:hypothetical protein
MLYFRTIISAMKEITTDTTKVLDSSAFPHDTDTHPTYRSYNELIFNALQSSTHPRLNATVTIYHGIHPQPFKYTTLRGLFLEMLSDDASKKALAMEMIKNYETYLRDASKGIKVAKKAYDDIKNQLNGFSMGEFSYRNDKQENCVRYVSCLVFDLDGCKSLEEVTSIQQNIKKCTYIFASFPSPSGHGLRIFIWVSATYETHRIIYAQVLKKLCQDLALTTDRKNGTHFDSTCQNESRFFYYTWLNSELFYLNIESTVLEKFSQNNIFEKQIDGAAVSAVEIMAQLDAQLNGFFEGRNDRLFHLGMRFKNNDISLGDAESYATKFVEFDFSMKEISTTLKSAYKIAQTQYTEEQKKHFLSKNESHKISNDNKATPLSTNNKQLKDTKSID